MTTILGRHAKSGISVHLISGHDRVTKGPTRHVVLKSAHSAKPTRIMSGVPANWSDDKIVSHIKKTHGSKFDGFKFTTEAVDPKKPGKTVLSGGEHNPTPLHQSDGKRDKITISGAEVKATTLMKVKESVFEQEQAKNRKAAESEYKRSHKNALDSSRGYHVDNQRYSHNYDNAGNHFMHVTTHDGKFSTKFAVHHKPTGVKLVLAGYTHSIGEEVVTESTKKEAERAVLAAITHRNKFGKVKMHHTSINGEHVVTANQQSSATGATWTSRWTVKRNGHYLSADPRPFNEGRALTVAQRLQRGRQIKRIAPKLKRAARRALTQSPSSNRIWKRSERAARNVLKKRFSPVKGVPYAKLTTTQKIFVDKALEKRQKLIRKVAKRLLPKVRQAIFKRLQTYRAGTGRSRLRENEAFEAMFNQRPLPKIIESMIIDMGDHPMADSLMTLLDLSAEKDSPAVKSLKEKAESIKVPFAEILQVYADALLEYKRTGSKLTGEQYAFNAVNVYVADRRGPSLNESFEKMHENLAGIMLGNHMMFGKTSVISKGFGGGRVPSGPGGSRDHYSPRDREDDKARGVAMHSYAKEVHSNTVKAAGDDPTRHKYNPNPKFGSKAKHSSYPAKVEAEVVDRAHSEAKSKYPNEYAVSPHHAITAHFQKNEKQRYLATKVHAYDKHYRAAKGLKESSPITFTESFSSKKHDGKRETDNTKVHDIHWKGKNTGHKLIRVSTGITSGGDRYQLKTSTGRLSDISMTAGAWQKSLVKQFQKHDVLKQYRSKKVKEETEEQLGEGYRSYRSSYSAGSGKPFHETETGKAMLKAVSELGARQRAARDAAAKDPDYFKKKLEAGKLKKEETVTDHILGKPKIQEVFGWGKKKEARGNPHEMTRYYNMGMAHAKAGKPKSCPTTAPEAHKRKYHEGYDDHVAPE